MRLQVTSSRRSMQPWSRRVAYDWLRRTRGSNLETFGRPCCWGGNPNINAEPNSQALTVVVTVDADCRRAAGKGVNMDYFSGMVDGSGAVGRVWRPAAFSVPDKGR